MYSKIDKNIKRKIKIELTDDKKSVCISIGKEGLKFLLEEIEDFKEGDFVQYDRETGYDLGILEKDSLGLIINFDDRLK